jgi:hypothetical protein
MLSQGLTARMISSRRPEDRLNRFQSPKKPADVTAAGHGRLVEKKAVARSKPRVKKGFRSC